MGIGRKQREEDLEIERRYKKIEDHPEWFTDYYGHPHVPEDVKPHNHTKTFLIILGCVIGLIIISYWLEHG